MTCGNSLHIARPPEPRIILAPAVPALELELLRLTFEAAEYRNLILRTVDPDLAEGDAA